MTVRHRRRVAAGIGLLLTAGLITTAVVLLHPDPGTSRATAAAHSSIKDTYRPPTEAQLAALPEARYDAVIAGLQPYAASAVPAAANRAYSMKGVTAVYDAINGHAVARLDPENFLHQKTVVLPVAFEGKWALVLTPSRQALPSSSAAAAAAQTAGWVRVDTLKPTAVLRDHIEIDVARNRLKVIDAHGSVEAAFTIGVGAAGTPTPTNVLGYLQARYLDPTQGQARYPINLTSLHATTRDEPYEGHDGGLIGMHFHWVTTGAVSHGCLRLPAAALAAIDALPVGTPILLRP